MVLKSPPIYYRRIYAIAKSTKLCFQSPEQNRNILLKAIYRGKLVPNKSRNPSKAQLKSHYHT